MVLMGLQAACLCGPVKSTSKAAAVVILFLVFCLILHSSDTRLSQPVSSSVHQWRKVFRYDIQQERNDVETEDGIRYPENAVHNAEMFLEKQDPASLEDLLSLQQGIPNPNRVSFDDICCGNKTYFNIYGDDTLVFLHIQKTGGTTLEYYLTRYLDISSPCKCLLAAIGGCGCFRPSNASDTFTRKLFSSTFSFNMATVFGKQWQLSASQGLKQWLFSRYSPGWLCGLHGDWTELITGGCVDAALDQIDGQAVERRHFVITILREPVARFLSEFHQGHHWRSPRICKGRIASPIELPDCLDGHKWHGATLERFLDCPYNMAFNRQTRMLADLTLVDCYNKSFMRQDERDRIILKSAKENLASMAFFGLLEEMEFSKELVFQKLFTSTFGLRFTQPLKALNVKNSSNVVVTREQLTAVKEKNRLDIELYRFAMDLFHKRLKMLMLDKNDTARPVAI